MYKSHNNADKSELSGPARKRHLPQSSYGSDSDKDNRHDSRSLLKELILLAQKYDYYLQTRPVITKCLTSGIIFGLGDLISQIIAKKPDVTGRFSLRSTIAYTTFGFVISGPIIHIFYKLLDKYVPKTGNLASLQRTLIDRLLLAPPYLLLLYYTVPLLEGRSLQFAHNKVKETFLPVMKMNIQVWSLFQYININFVPQKYRVLFMAVLSLFWNIYVAIKRR